MKRICLIVLVFLALFSLSDKVFALKKPATTAAVEKQITIFKNLQSKIQNKLDQAVIGVDPTVKNKISDFESRLDVVQKALDVISLRDEISGDLLVYKNALTYADQQTAEKKIKADLKTADSLAVSFVKDLKKKITAISQKKNQAVSDSSGFKPSRDKTEEPSNQETTNILLKESKATTTAKTAPVKDIKITSLVYKNSKLLSKWTGGAAPYTVLEKINEGEWKTAAKNLDVKSFESLLPSEITLGGLVCYKVSGGTKISEPKCYSYSPKLLPIKPSPSRASSKAKASNVTAHGATISWKKIEGIAGYAIYRNDIFVATVKADEITFLENYLLPDQTYTYKIVPLKNLDDKIPQNFLNLQSSIQSSGAFRLLGTAVFAANSTVDYQAITVKTKESRDTPRAGIIRVLAIITQFEKNQETDTIKHVNEVLNGNEYGHNGSKEILEENSSYKLNPAKGLTLTADVVGPVLVESDLKDFDLASKKLDLYVEVNRKAIAELMRVKADPRIRLDEYDVIIYVLPNLNSKFDGRVDETRDINAEVTKGILWIRGVRDTTIYGHEIGHLLGLGHANSAVCSEGKIFDECIKVPYADESDLMGNKGISRRFDVYRRNLLGWIPSETLVESDFVNVTEKKLLKVSGGNGLTFYLDPNFSLKAAVKDIENSKTNQSLMITFMVSNFKFAQSFEPAPSEGRWTIIKLSDFSSETRGFIRFHKDAKTPSAKQLQGSATVKINWPEISKISDNQGGYELRRYDTSLGVPKEKQFEKAEIIKTNLKTNSYEDTTAKPGKTYIYFLRGYDAFNGLYEKSKTVGVQASGDRGASANLQKFFLPYRESQPFKVNTPENPVSGETPEETTPASCAASVPIFLVSDPNFTELFRTCFVNSSCTCSKGENACKVYRIPATSATGITYDLSCSVNRRTIQN